MNPKDPKEFPGFGGNRDATFAVLDIDFDPDTISNPKRNSYLKRALNLSSKVYREHGFDPINNVVYAVSLRASKDYQRAKKIFMESFNIYFDTHVRQIEKQCDYIKIKNRKGMEGCHNVAAYMFMKNGELDFSVNPRGTPLKEILDQLAWLSKKANDHTTMKEIRLKFKKLYRKWGLL